MGTHFQKFGTYMGKRFDPWVARPNPVMRQVTPRELAIQQL